MLFALVKCGCEVVASEGEVVGGRGGDRHVSSPSYAGAFLSGGVGLVSREGDEFAAELAYSVFTLGRIRREVFDIAFGVEVALTGCDHAGDDGFRGGALDYATTTLLGGGEVGRGKAEGLTEPV